MKVALGVCGGIAAYKAAEIVRLLQDRGIRVQVIMTDSAQEFVRPLTFAALSGEKVITGMFSPETGTEPNIDSAIEHIAVAQSMDALLVVPATADVLAKFAQGIANDFLTTVYLATTAPVVLAPAMAGQVPVSLEELSYESPPDEQETEIEAPPEPERPAPLPQPGLLSQFLTLTKRRFLIFWRNKAQFYLQLGLIFGFPVLVAIFALEGLPAVQNLSMHRPTRFATQ